MKAFLQRYSHPLMVILKQLYNEFFFAEYEKFEENFIGIMPKNYIFISICCKYYFFSTMLKRLNKYQLAQEKKAESQLEIFLLFMINR